MWSRTLLECAHFEGCLVASLCSLFWPCQFWGRLIDIYHTPPFVLSMQKQSISVGCLLCTRISVTIILMKFTRLFHLCLSWLHNHNVHYGLGQPIHSSPGELEACTHSFLKHIWGSNFESFPTLIKYLQNIIIWCLPYLVSSKKISFYNYTVHVLLNVIWPSHYKELTQQCGYVLSIFIVEGCLVTFL